MTVKSYTFRLSFGGALIVLFVGLMVASVAGAPISPWLMAAPLVGWAALTLYRVTAAIRHGRDLQTLAKQMEAARRGN